MTKFLDLAGLVALWNKIKNTFIGWADTANATTISIDSTPTSNSTNLITSGGVYGSIPKDYEIDYSKRYLTIVSLEDNNTIGWKASNTNILKTISVSTDLGKTWIEKTSSITGTTLTTLNTRDKLLIKGSNAAYGNATYFNYFTSTGNFNLEGNIMSLCYGDNFIGQTTLTTPYTFIALFTNSYIKSAENLILPATTLTTGCYKQMFYECISLVTTSELPATALAQACYSNMFKGCTSLIKTPELPATTLAEYCYYSMFESCTSLTIVPKALPATTLANFCYLRMFYSCSSLTTAPELPATTLANYCYYNMFNSCTSLNYIKCLATNKSAPNCLTTWVTNVAASGTFIMDLQGNWTYGNSGIPGGWRYYFEHSQNYIYDIQKSGNWLIIYKKSYNGVSYPSISFSNVAFSGNYNDLSNKPTIPNPLINITSNEVNSKVEKFNGNTVKEVIIPINTTSNIYSDESDSGDEVSTTEIIPYINLNSSINDNYLILELGEVLKNNDVIIDSSLIGTNFNCHPSILYNNGYLLIYPTLPMNLILNLMQYLYVKYYTQVITSNKLYLWFDDYNDGNYDELDLSRWVYHDGPIQGLLTWREYVEDYLITDTYHYLGANGYKYTGETFDWGGTDYYLWVGITKQASSVKYMITPTIDYDTLYNNSLEANYLNHWCPYISKFDGDYQGLRYDAPGNDILVAVSNDPLVELTLWIEYTNSHNHTNWADWYHYVDNYLLNSSEHYGNSNEYYYTGETFEWEDVEYYLWEESDWGIYILTDTISYQELYNKSIEADYTNTVCPYVALLDSDGETIMYEALERHNDWLIKVIENQEIPGQAWWLYIDDF